MIPILVIVFSLLGPLAVAADTAVKTVDFLEPSGCSVNAAGPVFVQIDEARNRLLVANTLTSSFSVVDCATRTVKNIPLDGRALQHLKIEAMTLNANTGDVYLVGTSCVYVISPEKKKSRTIPTRVQFESVAVDERTGNVFVAGRESKTLGKIDNGASTLQQKKWLDTSEDLINLNATPPPPIRKVIADNTLGRIIAVDGIDPALYIFDGKSGELVESRPLSLESGKAGPAGDAGSPGGAGGRWHLAGYDPEDHALFLVVERADRKVVQAARIGVLDNNDVVVPLPEFTEGVGIAYNAPRKEIYIAYDNHPSIHVVDFGNGGVLDEIAIPAFGNDAVAVDNAGGRLYVGSWARGEVNVVDLDTRTLVKRITHMGIIPHMFTMAFNPNDGLVYFPKGATAVNGTFGAAVTLLDPATEKTSKIYTGWSPIDLVELPSRGGFLVFNSEDAFADVRADGTYELHRLPYDYPVCAVGAPDGDVYLSYGPHQSYWPTVYIWDAKNGVLTVNHETLGFYDRRIPRQAHRMVLDENGALYFTQNNWGKEEQFIGTLRDGVRLFEANQRLRLTDEVTREITQRILEYDAASNQLYLVRTGESDGDPSILQVIDPYGKTVTRRIELGQTAADLIFDDDHIYVANFDSRTVSVIDKTDFTVGNIEAGEQPLRLCRLGNSVMVINHAGNTLQEVRENGYAYKMPHDALPDNVFVWRDKAVITSHNNEALYVVEFDPQKRKFETLHTLDYPFGDTRFDTRNVSFYVRGQFGDVVFEITKGKTDADGRLWITDFLSGKLLILE